MAIFEHEFTGSEYARRRAATLSLAEEAGVECVLAFGENRSGLHVTYLNGWAVTRLAYLRLDRDGCRMWVQFHNHVPYARRVAFDTEVLDVDGSMVDSLLEGASRIGTLGTVPAAVLRGAAERGIELVPLDAAHAVLRNVKSEEEIDALRLGAQASDVGALGLIDACVPGASDWDLLAAARSAYTRVGARDHICYICVSDVADPDRDVPSQVPEGRILTENSVVTFELSASVAPEYPGQILRTIFLGEPTAQYLALHDSAMKARKAMRAAMRDGAESAAVVDAAACIDEAGFTTTDDLFHGLGMGYLEPVGVSPSRAASSPARGVLRAGMSVVVQPNVTTRDHRAGVQTGEMVVVRAGGIEDLHGLPEGPVMMR